MCSFGQLFVSNFLIDFAEDVHDFAEKVSLPSVVEEREFIKVDAYVFGGYLSISCSDARFIISPKSFDVIGVFITEGYEVVIFVFDGNMLLYFFIHSFITFPSIGNECSIWVNVVFEYSL